MNEQAITTVREMLDHLRRIQTLASIATSQDLSIEEILDGIAESGSDWLVSELPEMAADWITDVAAVQAQRAEAEAMNSAFDRAESAANTRACLSVEESWHTHPTADLHALQELLCAARSALVEEELERERFELLGRRFNALHSGVKCRVCSRALKTEQSKARGIGPECWETVPFEVQVAIEERLVAEAIAEQVAQIEEQPETVQEIEDTDSEDDENDLEAEVEWLLDVREEMQAELTDPNGARRFRHEEDWQEHRQYLLGEIATIDAKVESLTEAVAA